MANYIMSGLLALLLGGIVFYLTRQKKKGVKCVGCPHGGQCSGHCGGSKQ